MERQPNAPRQVYGYLHLGLFLHAAIYTTAPSLAMRLIPPPRNTVGFGLCQPTIPSIPKTWTPVCRSGKTGGAGRTAPSGIST
jgi:hypothetical protein